MWCFLISYSAIVADANVVLILFLLDIVFCHDSSPLRRPALSSLNTCSKPSSVGLENESIIGEDEQADAIP